MIIVKLQGGLGNQLFQYALARQLAEIHKTEFKLDVSFFQTYKLHAYSLSPFNIQEKIASQNETEDLIYNSPTLMDILQQKILRKKPVINSNYIRENYFHYDSGILSLPDNVYLDGYWQSEKYFSNIGNIIRSEFSVRKLQSGENKEMSEKIFSKNSVCMHIRRGSYTMPPYNATHGTCQMNYYLEGIDYFSKKIKNPHFFVFSDDPDWTSKNLKINSDITYVNHNSVNNDFEDLRLMSQCKHHIIANSTFSWWSAWLCNNPGKIIIAPQDWFKSGDRDTRDLFPASWIRL